MVRGHSRIVEMLSHLKMPYLIPQVKVPSAPQVPKSCLPKLEKSNKPRTLVWGRGQGSNITLAFYLLSLSVEEVSQVLIPTWDHILKACQDKIYLTP